MLGLRARVESKDEVVAIAIRCSLLSRGFREHEDAPVRDTSDYTAGREDDIAGCSCDSMEAIRVERGEGDG